MRAGALIAVSPAGKVLPEGPSAKRPLALLSLALVTPTPTLPLQGRGRVKAAALRGFHGRAGIG